MFTHKLSMMGAKDMYKIAQIDPVIKQLKGEKIKHPALIATVGTNFNEHMTI